MAWQDTLKSLAPTVLSAALGPAGAGVVSAIGAIIGIAEPTQDKIAEAIQAGKLTPDQITELKKLEMQLQADEKERGFRYAELEFKQDSIIAQDRADARAMQVATHSRMPAILTIMVTVGFFGVLTALLAMPELKANEIVLVMVGQLSAVWGACVAFYVSTTFNSANKTKMLAESLPVK